MDVEAVPGNVWFMFACLCWFFFFHVVCLLLAGMYHMFLLIKDGFFHITNLSLAKIESGIKICVPHIC